MHRHGRCRVHRLGPRADHRRADLGAFQGRRRRREGPGARSRSIAGRSKRRSQQAEATLAARHGAGRPTRKAQAHALPGPRRSAASRRKEQVEQMLTSAAALEATRRRRSRGGRKREGPAASTRRSPRRFAGRTGLLQVHEGNLVRANDTAPIVTINRITPVYVSFAMPEALLPELKRYMATGHAQRRGASRPTTTGRRRSAASTSSTTRSIRRPARSRSRARSRTTDRRLWPASSSTSTVTLTTDPRAVVVPIDRGADRPAGHVRVRRQAGSDRRAAPGDGRPNARRRVGDQDRRSSPAKPS